MQNSSWGPGGRPLRVAASFNSAFNADANKGHGFAIVLALVGALQSLRSFWRRLPWALSLSVTARFLWKFHANFFAALLQLYPLLA